MKKEWTMYQDRIPEPDMEKKEQARQKMLCEMEQYRMTDLEFICGQIRFVRPSLWVVQLLFWLVVGVSMYRLQASDMQEYRLYSLIAMVTPVLFVFQIEQFAKIYQQSMLEIELTTRFSLKKLLLARLLIFGTVDLFVLAGWIAFWRVGAESDLWRIALYSLVPFNLMVAGLFALLRFEHSGHYSYIAISYMSVLGGLFDVLARWQPEIYGTENEIWWVAILVITLLLGVRSVCVLLKYNTEKGVQNEINFETNDEMLWR